MELIEMLGWVALGFVPMFGILEIASRKLAKTGRTVSRTEIVGSESHIGI
jgi:hypothetical protein